MQAKGDGRTAGRPRSEAARVAILRAAREQLAEHGLGGMTVENVAARAGVGKATIYRWWPSRGAVVLDALLEVVGAAVPTVATGTAYAALRTQAHAAAAALDGPLGRIIAAVLAEAQTSSEFATELRERFFLPRRAEAKKIISRGQAGGEFQPNADADFIIDSLFGPMYYRLMVGHLPLEKSFVDQLLDQVLGTTLQTNDPPGRATTTL